MLTKRDYFYFQVKSNYRRFSLPQSYLPNRNLGTNQHRQPVPSPFHFNAPSSSTEAKRRTKESPSLPPYGLCCQLTAVKAQDEKEELTSRANEERSRGEHVQYNELDARHAQTWRNVYYSSSTDKRLPSKRHSVATTGGKELLKSINNTLGRLVEIQEKPDPSKTTESLLQRSRLPPATLNSSLKHDSPIEGVKLSLIHEHPPVERAKARQNSNLTVSCSVKDTHSPKPPSLSNSTGALNPESSLTKEQTNRVKKTKVGLAEKSVRRRRRRTIESKIPIETNNDILLSKHEESTCLRRSSRDDNIKNDPTRDALHSGRRSRDSIEEII